MQLEKVAALQTPDQVLHTEEEGKLQSKQKKDSQPIVEVIQSENVETAQRKEASQPQYYGKSSDREPAVYANIYIYKSLFFSQKILGLLSVMIFSLPLFFPRHRTKNLPMQKILTNRE